MPTSSAARRTPCWARAFQPWDLILPLGISFFVFQKISYLIDLRRGDRHIYGFLDFCMFVTFFPQLIAGPIVRHNEIIHQFRVDPRTAAMWENLSRGFVLFVIGVAKKVALADTLAMVADPLFGKAVTASLTATEAWIATARLHAADLLRLLRLLRHGDRPRADVRPSPAAELQRALSRPSIRDFWRRWHMTLSRFLRDYLYIPLGGNRCGPLRQAANVIATMLLGGLWHGANWTFVAWGGLHGAALAVNHVWQGRGLRLPRPAAWALTLLFVMACWVLFRSADFTTAGDMLLSMVGQHGAGEVSLDREFIAALIGGAAVALLGPTSQEVALERLQPKAWLAMPAGVALAYLLLLVGGRLPNVFIYFQF